MINRIEIENFILIDHQIMEFDQQINVLTGDTGSGKSVIINSIRFVLGMRANSDLFLDQSKNIKITANLCINQQLANKLDEHQIEYDDEVEVMRVLSPNGKSKVRINGELVTSAVTLDIFADIISIYSQYSVAKFKSDNSYLEIVDSLIEDHQLFTTYNEKYEAYFQLDKQLNKLKQEALLKVEKQELLELRLADLQQIDDQIDLEELIVEKQELDQHATNQQISNLASEQLQTATAALHQLLKTVTMDNHVQLLNDALINIDEVSFDLAKAGEPIDEARLSFISDYISMCRRLARKYNVEVEKLGEFKQNLQTEYDNLDAIDADISNLTNKLEKVRLEAMEAAKLLSVARHAIVPRLAEDVNSKLKQLSLVESDFRISLSETPLTKSGIDACRFEVRMNEGGQYTLIHKTASGGEIARFLLALEAVVSSNDQSAFIIFDEIDTGVSGHVATEMANMMKQISKRHKLLVVTHLAQVAAISENHFVISKATTGDYTTSQAKLLDEEQKPVALAKMISGIETSAEAIAHAKTLLAQSN
ncbi:AAA family ATPase [Mollicutes bacterium LVI A0039]|nr:AAA family ATPase [Mollicutes bacterium LVI A0039]